MLDRENTQKLITIYNRRLQKLRETHALYGLNTQPEVEIEIEDIETKLKRLGAELLTEQDELLQTEATLNKMVAEGKPVTQALSEIQQNLAQVKNLLTDLIGREVDNVIGKGIGTAIVGRDLKQGDTRTIITGDCSIVNSSASGDIIAGSGNQKTSIIGNTFANHKLGVEVD